MVEVLLTILHAVVVHALAIVGLTTAPADDAGAHEEEQARMTPARYLVIPGETQPALLVIDPAMGCTRAETHDLPRLLAPDALSS